MKIIALDVGSSSIKGALVDCESRAITNVVTRPFPAPLADLPRGHFEVDPRLIESEVGRVLDTLTPHAADSQAIFVSGQMGGTILVDAAGEPRSNYLSWRDQRTLETNSQGRSHLQAIRERWGDGLLLRLGNELPAGSAFALLYALAEHDQLPRNCFPISIGDYVVGRLARRPPTMHVTQCIGMLDLGKATWHTEALERLGLRGIKLAELSTTIESKGAIPVSGRALPVYGAYGDQQCALRGANLQRGELSINVSTGSQVSQRTAVFSPGNFQTRFYFEGDWLDTITHLPAGRSLNVLLDLLTELSRSEGVELRDAWSNVVRLASEAHAQSGSSLEDSALDLDLAFFAGPMGERGAIRGITTENLTVGNLFLAAFRNMADNYLVCSQRFDGEPWKQVVVSGGLVQAVPPLRAMIDERMGDKRRFGDGLRFSSGEETFLGLAALACHTLPR